MSAAIEQEANATQPPNDKPSIVAGGSFLIDETRAENTFAPEDFTEEQRMIADTARQFVENDVRARIDELEAHKWNVSRELITQAAELGLIGAGVPEEYGGLGLDQTTGVIIAEEMGRGASFGTTFGANVGIGTLPIIYFGTDEAKNKYLPKLASGEFCGAYALSEAGSGSDALGAKASARLSEDGTHYILNGEKMWISNAGFADTFIVFAKVDGEREKFSGFIVEATAEGLTTGNEEHKLGIKGSSTRPLILNDVKTPVENVLGKVGDGAKIAFNILNIGRFKLGASCVGGMKLCITESVRYANERKQFGKSISSFGAIKHKLAEMAIKTWIGESMTYRTVGLIESAIEAGGGSEADGSPESSKAKLRAIEEYATECSIIKVALSESADYVSDEMVQIYGGYGYVADYPAERAYRDSRINRIYEGTNEINRMLIPGTLMKRAMKGQLALMPAAQNLMGELLSPSMPTFDEDDAPLATEAKLVANAKKVALMVLGTAAQKYMAKLAEQQEVLMGAADIIIEIYAMESGLLRAQKMIAANGEAKSERYASIVQVFINDAMQRIDTSAKNTLAAIVEGDELRTLLTALKRFTKQTPINTVAMRQRIADGLISANKYAV